MAPESVFTNSCFTVDTNDFMRSVETAVYGRRFTRYLLIKLDFFYHDHAHRMTFESLSVEHVLPQNPANGSQWSKDFTEEQRKEYTNKLGNLVLITTHKNTSQGRSDYAEKKERYFKSRINTCPNSLRVLRNERWTPVELGANHNEVVMKIRQNYGIKTGNIA